MNTARGNQVLTLIDEAIDLLESEGERLALLLAECRREQYWKLRKYKSEKEWIADAFPERSLRTVRLLANLGQAYEKDPSVLSGIGVSKAEIIKNLPRRKSWAKIAAQMTVKELTQLIKQKIGRIRTPLQAQQRLALLEKKIERLRRQIEITEIEMRHLKSVWNERKLEESVSLVTANTRRLWKKRGLLSA